MPAGLESLIAAGELPVPRLHGVYEDAPWTALVLDDVDGRQPGVPRDRSELARVLAGIDRLAAALTPSPLATASVSERFADDFTGWRTLAEAGDRDQIDRWSRAHLTELAELERSWPEHLAGDTLLHADLRADNILLTGERVMSSTGRTRASALPSLTWRSWPRA